MQAEYREKVADVFCDVLEKLAFMFGEMAAKEELPQDSAAYVQAGMAFEGPFAGSLSLTVPEEMCPEIAANFLGMDRDEPAVHDRAHDALKEVLNVTCGHVLTAVAGPEPVFQLSVPEVTRLSVYDWDDLIDNPDSIGLLVDEKPVLIKFSTRAVN